MGTETGNVTRPPEGNQTLVVHDGKRYGSVQEGLATILVPHAGEDSERARKTSTDDHPGQQVFYNPIQQFNRDLTVLAIKAYGQEVIEKKKAAYEGHLVKIAEKKRKRKEQGNTDAPQSKAPKLDDGAKEEGGGPSTPSLQGVENQDVADKGQKPSDVNGELHKPHGHSTFTILDALSATGLRALRYAKEIPFVTSITSNDLQRSAVDSIKLNVAYNGLHEKIIVTQDDALAHMYSLVARELRARDPHGKPKNEKYDVIDLDPYGTAATFFDAAVQAVRDDGGLLCVTCTDTGVWASIGYPEKAFALYGGATMKGEHSHEAGLRLILHALGTSAARYGLAIEPLLSLSIDYYARLFVRVRKSPAAVKFQASKTMIVYTCDAGCGAWTTQLLLRSRSVPNKKNSGHFYKHGPALGPTAEQVCEHCGTKRHVAGPMFAGRLHSPAFIRSVLNQLQTASPEVYGTRQRIEGMLQTALEETILSPEEEAEMKGEIDAKTRAPETGVSPASTPAIKANENSLETIQAQAAAIDPYPFFFVPAQIASIIHCQTPGENALRGAFLGLGYQVTRSHCKRGSMKTNAPWSVIWHVMREWVRQKAPVTVEHVKPGTAGYRILGLDRGGQPKSPEEVDVLDKAGAEIVFDEKLGRYPPSKLVRYQANPSENWGPMNRARGR